MSVIPASPSSARTHSPRLERWRAEWLGNPRADVLAGIVVALALIPEAIAFSLIAGVDPAVGLYASFSIAMIIAFTGGRPAMISAATGAMALVMVPLVREHGVEYLFAATILTGLLQVVFGWLRVGQLMRFVPRTVMTGFVNALAILIFLAQLPYVLGQSPAVWAIVVAGLAIMYGLPRLTTAVPAPLVAIVVLTAATVGIGLDVPDVGGMGQLPDTLPVLGLPAVPFDLTTLGIVAPYALALAFVGLLESLLTAQLIDDRTHTRSDKDRECRGQGIANVATGFLGGMAGCAMIGQSMINVSAGARTRLSTFTAGLSLLVLVLTLGDLVAMVPMAALVAVMVVVAVATFDWSSIAPTTLRQVPRTETLVTAATVGVVVVTHNLAYGVLAGVLLAMVVFARRAASHASVASTVTADGATRTYTVVGELFFASTNGLVHSFDLDDPAGEVVIDLSHAKLWDSSAVATFDGLVERYAARGVQAHLTGLCNDSAELHQRLSGQLVTAH